MHIDKVRYDLVSLTLSVEDCHALTRACNAASEVIVTQEQRHLINHIEAMGVAFEALTIAAQFQSLTPIPLTRQIQQELCFNSLRVPVRAYAA